MLNIEPLLLMLSQLMLRWHLPELASADVDSDVDGETMPLCMRLCFCIQLEWVEWIDLFSSVVTVDGPQVLL